MCACVCDHVLVYGCVQVLCVRAHTCAGLLLGGFLLVQVRCLLLDIIVGVLRHPEHTTQQPVHTLQYTYCTVYDVHITYVHTHIYIYHRELCYTGVITVSCSQDGKHGAGGGKGVGGIGVLT